jgi:uncharacterized protein with PQ loop repeat
VFEVFGAVGIVISMLAYLPQVVHLQRNTAPRESVVAHG